MSLSEWFKRTPASTSEQAFWEWFVDHEEEIMNFEADQEQVFDRLAAQLRKINPDLTFEFGPRGETREFVISAGGIRAAFPSVSALVAAAPKLSRWHVTAFRPRRPAGGSIEINGKRIHSQDIQFSLITDGKNAGIQLFIPGYVEENSVFKQIGYLFLDEALGEYDVETKVGPIQMFAPAAKTEGERYPFSQLTAKFDRLIAQLFPGGSVH